MLEGKQGQQSGIDCQSVADRSLQSGIDGPRHAKIAQERYGIQKAGKKYEIAKDPVEQG